MFWRELGFEGVETVEIVKAAAVSVGPTKECAEPEWSRMLGVWSAS